MTEFKKMIVSSISVRCPREPWKTVEVQIRYSVYSNGERKLEPIMYCHNEYGLEACFKCKKKLYELMTNNSREPLTLPVELHPFS